MSISDKRSFIGKLYVWLSVKLLSDICSSTFTVVFATYALSLTQSAGLLGIVLTLQLLGAVIGGLISPRIKHMTRRDMMVLSDLASGAVVLVFALVPLSWQALLIYVTPLLLGICQGLFRVAILSEVPILVGQAGRHGLNALLSASDGGAVIVGGIIAASIAHDVSFAAIFITNAVSFLLVALTFQLTRRHLRDIEVEIAHGTGTQLKTDVAGSVRPTAGVSGKAQPLLQLMPLMLTMVIAARFFEALGSSTHNVGFPIISTNYRPDNTTFLFGWIIALWGAGRLLSAMLVLPILRNMERRARSLELFFIVALIITFGFFFLVFYANSFLLIVFFSFCAGVFDATTETTYYSVLQANVEQLRHRVISASYVVERGGLGIGMLMVGFSYSTIGTMSTVSWFYGGSSLFAALILLKVVQLHTNTKSDHDKPLPNQANVVDDNVRQAG